MHPRHVTRTSKAHHLFAQFLISTHLMVISLSFIISYANSGLQRTIPCYACCLLAYVTQRNLRFSSNQLDAGRSLNFDLRLSCHILNTVIINNLRNQGVDLCRSSSLSDVRIILAAEVFSILCVDPGRK
ncbi:hypothetical protein PUN28_006501 [Cardiocondyla obscurior]|uniref:Uncharacterized protein n=1 Tax=Cardiocondyla obscurior TaxID=286306 RepID=A0AAW2GBU6_9HYME